jgi:uncharacterized membrane protein
MNYYDIVLGLIPFGLATIATALFVFGVALTAAVAVASVFAAGLIGHAMFIRGPVGPMVEAPTSPTAQADSRMVQAD